MFDKLVDLLVSWMKLFFFTVVMHADQRGIVLRFGKLVREIGPGIHFKWPFEIEEVYYREVTPTLLIIGPQSLTTRDDITIVVSVAVTFHVADVPKAILSVQGLRQVIEDSVYGMTANYVRDHSWEDLRSLSAGIDNEIAKAARRRAKVYGVHIDDIQFCDLTKSRSLRLIGSPHEQNPYLG